MKVKSEREVTQSCLTLRDPMDRSLPGSSVHGIFRARVLEWGAITFSTKGGQALPTLSPHRGKAGDYLLSHTLWHFCVICGWVSGNPPMKSVGLVYYHHILQTKKLRLRVTMTCRGPYHVPFLEGSLDDTLCGRLWFLLTVSCLRGDSVNGCVMATPRATAPHTAPPAWPQPL